MNEIYLKGFYLGISVTMILFITYCIIWIVISKTYFFIKKTYMNWKNPLYKYENNFNEGGY
jgi:hypothetical protein